MPISARTIKSRVIQFRNIQARVIQFSGEICRWFSQFNGTSSFAQFTDDIVLTGELSLSIDFNTPTASQQTILGSSVSNTELSIFTDGHIELKINDVTPISSAAGVFSVDDDNTILITRDGANLVTIKLNDVSVATGTNSNTWTITTISEIAGNLFEGIPSNLNVIDSGTEIVNMPMDERYFDIRDELIYRNLARQETWYLSLMGGSIDVSPVELINNFEIQGKFFVRQSLAIGNTAVCGGGSFSVFMQSSGATLAVQIPRLSGGPAYISMTSNLVIGANFEFSAKRIGDVYSITANGTTKSVSVPNFAPISFSEVAALSGGLLLEQDLLVFSVWSNGTELTGTKVLDYDFNSPLSNVIPNAASTTSANLWDGSSATATGESSVIDSNTINVLRTGASNSQVSVVAAVAGLDVLIQVTVVSGSLDNIIVGDTTTEFTGWENIRDANDQPIPNRFQTLTNNDAAFIVFKTNGMANVTMTNITGQTVTGYGVLSGTLGVDAEYLNDSPNAIGHNITVEQDPECTGLVWIDGQGWVDADDWID